MIKLVKICKVQLSIFRGSEERRRVWEEEWWWSRVGMRSRVGQSVLGFWRGEDGPRRIEGVVGGGEYWGDRGGTTSAGQAVQRSSSEYYAVPTSTK